MKQWPLYELIGKETKDKTSKKEVSRPELSNVTQSMVNQQLAASAKVYAMTYEPLSIIGREDSVTCAIYAKDAKENKLLVLEDWRQFRRLAYC